MSQFNEELLNVVLNFKYNRQDMADADKMASKMAFAFDRVVKQSLQAGKSVNDVVQSIKRFEPSLKNIATQLGDVAESANLVAAAQKAIGRFTPNRVKMASEQLLGMSADHAKIKKLGEQLDKNTAATKKLADIQSVYASDIRRGGNNKQEVLTSKTDSSLGRQVLRLVEKSSKELSSVSLSVDNAVRAALASGRPVDAVAKELAQVLPALKALARGAQNPQVAGIARGIQRTLAGYTPARVERMQEYGNLRREAFGRRNTLMADKFKAVESEVSSVLASESTRLQKTLRGFSNGAKVMVMDIEATNKSTLEFHAKLYKYNTETGKLGEVIDEYTAFQRYERLKLSTAMRFDKALTSGTGMVTRGNRQYRIPRDVRFVGNKGISLAELTDASGISPTRIMRMASRADVGIGHYPIGDFVRLDKVVPKLKTAIPWFDSSRDIPWNPLGFPSAAQQRLLVPHGINPGSSAHRAVGDVDTLVRLLNSSHPQSIGGGTYTSMMFSQKLGPGQRPEEQFNHVVAQGALGMMRQLSIAINSVTRYRGSNNDEEKVDDRGRITARGSINPTQESTPNYGGISLLKLDSDLRTVQEFYRNNLVVPASMAARLFSKYTDIAESRAGTIGLGSGRDTMKLGDDVFLDVMRGVNNEIDMQRSVSSKFRNGVMPILPEMISGRQTHFERQLQQPWAQPSTKFTSEQIDEFIRQHAKNPGVASIQTAAQMANHVGSSDPRFVKLASIVGGGQMIGQGFKASQKAQMMMRALTAASSTTETVKTLSPAEEMLEKSRLEMEARNEAIRRRRFTQGGSAGFDFLANVSTLGGYGLGKWVLDKIKNRSPNESVLDKLVKHAQENSDDLKVKVGAAIISKGQYTLGTNRFYSLPEGMTKEQAAKDRPFKLANITHAEVDAIQNAQREGKILKGSTIFTNYTPCENCASRIVESGIKKVVSPKVTEPEVIKYWQESWDKSKKKLAEGGVEFVEARAEDFKAHEALARRRATQRGSVNLGDIMDGSRILWEKARGYTSSLWEKVKGPFGSNSAATFDTSGDLRASIRKDALDSKLRKLYAYSEKRAAKKKTGGKVKKIAGW